MKIEDTLNIISHALIYKCHKNHFKTSFSSWEVNSKLSKKVWDPYLNKKVWCDSYTVKANLLDLNQAEIIINFIKKIFSLDHKHVKAFYDFGGAEIAIFEIEILNKNELFQKKLGEYFTKHIFSQYKLNRLLSPGLVKLCNSFELHWFNFQLNILTKQTKFVESDLYEALELEQVPIVLAQKNKPYLLRKSIHGIIFSYKVAEKKYHHLLLNLPVNAINESYTNIIEQANLCFKQISFGFQSHYGFFAQKGRDILNSLINQQINEITSTKIVSFVPR